MKKPLQKRKKNHVVSMEQKQRKGKRTATSERELTRGKGERESIGGWEEKGNEKGDYEARGMEFYFGEDAEDLTASDRSRLLKPVI